MRNINIIENIHFACPYKIQNNYHILRFFKNCDAVLLTTGWEPLSGSGKTFHQAVNNKGIILLEISSMVLLLIFTKIRDMKSERPLCKLIIQ